MSHRYSILRSFAEAYGPSSSEDEIRDVIKHTLGRSFSFKETAHGNLIAWDPKSLAKIQQDNANVLVLQAHMDELGFRPAQYLNDGFIRVVPSSHIPSSVDNHHILFKPGNTSGIVSVDSSTKPPRYFLDIGSDSAEKSKAEIPYYSVGAYCSWFCETETEITCKSLDDRAGCALIAETMLRSLKKKTPLVIVGVFTTREETGNWPIPELAHELRKMELVPQMLLNLEVCPGGPVYNDSASIARCGSGVGLVHMDRNYAACTKVCRHMVTLAETNEIPFQHVTMRVGGGELGRIAFDLGVRGYSLVIPGRYMHSPHSVISKKDYEAAFSLLKAVVDQGELP